MHIPELKIYHLTAPDEFNYPFVSHCYDMQGAISYKKP